MSSLATTAQTTTGTATTTATTTTTNNNNHNLRQPSKEQQFVQQVLQEEHSALARATAIRLRFASQRACAIILNNGAATACTLLQQQQQSLTTKVLNTAGTHDYCPLHVACEGGKVAVVHLLLARACNPFVVDTNGETPLFSCIRAQDKAAGVTCASAVLAHYKKSVAKEEGSAMQFKTFVNVQSRRDGGTVLHRACFKDHEALVDVLLETHAADVYLQNNRGTSSIDLARKVSALPSIQKKLREAVVVAGGGAH